VRLPRDLDDVRVRALDRIDYTMPRQIESHLLLILRDQPEHHITVPLHSPLRIGTMAAVLDDGANRDVEPATLLAGLLGYGGG